MTNAQVDAAVSRERSAVHLAGLAQGAVLATVPVAVGWFFIGPEFVTPVSISVVAGVALLAALGAWCAGFAVLRRRRVGREAAISWWTLGGTVLVAGVTTAVEGAIAFLFAMVTIAALWTGDFIEPIVIVAVLIGATSTVLIGIASSRVAARALSPARRPTPAPFI